MIACSRSGKLDSVSPAWNESTRRKSIFTSTVISLAHVMQVGSGSGYTCATFHHLVSPSDGNERGSVIGIDHIKQLVDWSVINLKADGLESSLSDGTIKMVYGDGRQGLPRFSIWSGVSTDKFQRLYFRSTL